MTAKPLREYLSAITSLGDSYGYSEKTHAEKSSGIKLDDV